MIKIDAEAEADLASMRYARLQREGLVAAPTIAPAPEAGIDAKQQDDTKQEKKQADVLISFAARADLFHSPDGISYADVNINGHRQTLRIKGGVFRRWLAKGYYEKTKSAPSSEALTSALNVIEAKAHFDGSERPVFIRIGGYDGKLYLDLCNDGWQAVEIDAAGWRLIDKPPVRFRRTAGMLPLPVPTMGGSVESLRGFLNLKSDADFVLIVAWLTAALRDCGPYPVLALSGEQGTAKSTLTAILRALLDPNTAPLRALPREDRDLFIAATNGLLLAFDNISGLPAWLSDTLCRLATGGGFAVRQLYTDNDEVLFSAMRPVILNGIEDIVTRPDLADRAIFITLEAIPEGKRKPEGELWAAFERERAQILGALLTALSRGLRNLPTTKLATLPRMADFALWGTASEEKVGAFSMAYDANRATAIHEIIEADAVATQVCALMAKQSEWTGTSSQLLSILVVQIGEEVAREQRKAKAWPVSPRALSGCLRRLAATLRKVGVHITFLPRENRGRSIRIASAPENGGILSSRPSRPSPTIPKTNYLSYLVSDSNGDASTAGDGRIVTTRYTDTPSGTANPLELNRRDGGDGRDAKIAPSAVEDRACVQCRGPVDGRECQVAIGDKTVSLHPECERFYREAQEWEKLVGPMPGFLDRNRPRLGQPPISSLDDDLGDLA
jgi:hypothetical protein